MVDRYRARREGGGPARFNVARIFGLGKKYGLGAAATPRVSFRKNPDGKVFTDDEALAAIEKSGIDVPDDVQIQFVNTLGRKDGAKAQYLQIGKVPEDKTITWRSFKNIKGKIPVTFERTLFDSEEEFLAHVEHEMFELRKLESFFEKNRAVPARKLREMINDVRSGGLPNNLHEQAWESADDLILQRRGGGVR